jgi:hypothetical protein
MFVKGAVVMIFAVLASQLSAPLVEHAWENDKAAEAGARTARRAYGEVHGKKGKRLK